MQIPTDGIKRMVKDLRNEMPRIAKDEIERMVKATQPPLLKPCCEKCSKHVMRSTVAKGTPRKGLVLDDLPINTCTITLTITNLILITSCPTQSASWQPFGISW
jgi:hypothetical protein